MTYPTQLPSQKPAEGPQLNIEAGRMVRTPAGNFAVVKAVYAVGSHVEVLVEYPEGERARFRSGHLRALP